jgi:hypothetical protein
MKSTQSEMLKYVLRMFPLGVFETPQNYVFQVSATECIFVKQNVL